MFRVLTSVSDKTDLAKLLLGLRKVAPHGLEIISTGGTQLHLVQAGLQVVPVEAYTQIPEGMDGRVKTLTHRIAAGLLYAGSRHDDYMNVVGAKPIHMVVVNFYPFEQKVESNAHFDECIENIDIGGPTMLREAIKNHANCLPICSPTQYERIQKTFQAAGKLDPACFDLDARIGLAATAMRAITEYDAPICRYLEACEAETMS